MTSNLLNLLSANNIVVYMLILTRLTGLMQTAPFFSTIEAPLMTRIWFSATIAFILYPLVHASKNFIIPHDMVEFTILLACEFLTGYLIGFIANMILEGARISGNILAIQTGLSMSEALDPETGVNATELSRIYIYFATFVFLMTGAHQMLFMTLYDSFSSVPMGVMPIMEPNIINSMVLLFAQVFKIAFGIALPIFSVLLISDILLGLMNKMMPQMNIYMVALPVKMYIGYILLIGFLSSTCVYLQGMTEHYMQALSLLFAH